MPLAAMASASSFPSRCHPALAVATALLCAIAGAVSSAAAAGGNGAAGRGPIATAGKNYTRVCDPARFAALGLDASRFRYCDASLPYADRVRDLVGRMTLEEKVRNLGDQAEGAPRVGLPPYKWWSEALHGLSSTGPTTLFDDLRSRPGNHSGRATVNNGTVFANVINSAASFNETLWKAIGQVLQ